MLLSLTPWFHLILTQKKILFLDTTLKHIFCELLNKSVGLIILIFELEIIDKKFIIIHHNC
jgi:hypothetical protein